MSAIDIQSILKQAQPSDAHDWLLSTAQVAEGYGVSDSTLRGHKSEKSDEFEENKHWIKGSKNQTLWTKRGVIQLGFHVQSLRAKQFRAMAEGWVLAGMEKAEGPPVQRTPTNFNLPDLDGLAQTIAADIAPIAAEQLLRERIQTHLPAAIDRNLEAAGETLGKSLSQQYGIDLSDRIAQAISQYRAGQKENSQSATSQPVTSQAKTNQLEEIAA